MEMIRAVLINVDEEPKVIMVNANRESYLKVIQDNLSHEERALCKGYGLDFFGVGLPNISGIVEEYSSCHPYRRNRTWHGVALFTQFDDEGVTVSMDDEHVEMLMNKFALSNKPKSPNDYINYFVEKYTPEPVIFNVDYDNIYATLNTLDYLDTILEETNEETLFYIEKTLRVIELAAKTEEDVKADFSDLLKELGTELLKEQASSLDPFSF